MRIKEVAWRHLFWCYFKLYKDGLGAAVKMHMPELKQYSRAILTYQVQMEHEFPHDDHIYADGFLSEYAIIAIFSCGITSRQKNTRSI